MKSATIKKFWKPALTPFTRANKVKRESGQHSIDPDRQSQVKLDGWNA